jgi:DNA-binding MarR family transcriptional regulator
LRKNGLIEKVFRDGDRRTKYLVPTTASDDYFDKLGRILVKAAAEQEQA